MKKLDAAVILLVLLLLGLATWQMATPGGPWSREDKAAFMQLVRVLPGEPSNGPPPLRLSVEVPRRHRPGFPVPMALVLRNVGEHPVHVTLGGGPHVDFVVARADGMLVWASARGGGFPDTAHERTLAPGEEWRFTTRWDQRTLGGWPVLPGTYYVRGLLLGLRTELLLSPVERLVIGLGR